MKPVSMNELPEDILERFKHYQNTRGFTPNSIQTMVRRPNIVRAFMQLNQAVLYEGTVDEELKMLVSLIASQVAGCRYCQAHMANLSKIYQASEEKISQVWNYEESDLFTAAEKAALRLAYHGAMSPSQSSQEHFDELNKHYDENEIVEIVATISLFGFLNRWNDTLATEIEQLPAMVAKETIGKTFNWEAGKHE
ncbi:MAG: carboxymuconolactone decarboxylase family protein [Woeseiaceae bacterium]|tara:strand:+ start:1242 stop:1826 length:585 start_codon:yes stop_codon:yes gene_type:complete